MPHVIFSPISLLALGLTACAGEEVTLYADPTPAPVQEVVWNSCTNPAAGYTVDYPQEWHTNTGGDLGECRLFDFDPEAIDVADGRGEVPPSSGVVVRMEPVGFPDFVAEDGGVEVIEAQDLEVDGHMAVRQELVATVGGPYPEGAELTRYVVDRDGGTLIAESSGVGERPYERKVQILDEMMSEERAGVHRYR